MAPEDHGLRIEGQGNVVVLRLDRPHRRNAIDRDTAIALTAFLEGATTDRQVRAMVVTGTDRDFCTGADIVGDKEAQERAATALISTTADRREGVQSFVEGRPPTFVGD
jgi:enoyl-CoA hydratase/carnithine racemase